MTKAGPVAQVAPAGTYSGVAAVAQQIMAKEGIRGFYKGLVPVLVRAFPANAACFLVRRLGFCLAPLPFSLACQRWPPAAVRVSLSAAPCRSLPVAFSCFPWLLRARALLSGLGAR
jgi:hypothetical protein